MSVAAKVLKTPLAVPQVTGPGSAPFNQAASLQPGIHLHWALPDALSRATALGGGTSSSQVVFPGAPDLWLVTRFNPVVGPNVPATGRSWRAWVVDSRAQKVTPLESWTAPAPPDASMVHTLPGVLPSAASAGYPGWGLLDPNSLAGKSFDDVMTAAVYYPSAGGRFGFYDDLSDLAGSMAVAGANVSYTVAGWYSNPACDPLYMSSNRDKQIEEWMFTYNRYEDLLELATAIAPTVTPLTWKPTVAIAQQTQPAVVDTQVKAVVEDNIKRTGLLQSLSSALGQAATAKLFPSATPSQMVCHGSILNVPLGASESNAAKPIASSIALYPSVKRAMAATAAPGSTDQQLDYTEMLLQDLDQQKGTMAGVMDLPGAAHALTFQSVPGQSANFGRIDIWIPRRIIPLPPLAIASATQGAAVSGYWPEMLKQTNVPDTVPGVNQTSMAQLTGKPDPAPWVAKVQAAFQAMLAAAAAANPPLAIDPRMVRVTDYRSKAQPRSLAPSLNGSGTDGAGWWIDITDTDALTQIFQSTVGTTATVSLPDIGNLYKQPGPRWYRPWSPQIVLTEAQRSYRFGEDGRFDANGKLKCRTSGHTAYAIRANTGAAVMGSALLANAAPLRSKAGLPSDLPALLNEALLLDPDNSASMAAAAAPGTAQKAVAAYFAGAIPGLYLQRLPSLTQGAANAVSQIKVDGDLPSPIAFTPWQDPYDPLFLDVQYGWQPSSVENAWELDEDQVEMTPRQTPLPGPPPAAPAPFTERTRVTATIARVLQSQLVTRMAQTPGGHPIVRQQPPNGLTAAVFQTKDLLSAPIATLDSALFAAGFRERCGAMQLNKLSLVDVFGVARNWDASGRVAPSPAPPPPLTLAPRLPYWSRLNFRLQSAADSSKAATAYSPAVCGILLPDFVDHSLEVFDGAGNGIGQLTCDAPRFGGGPGAGAATLNVKFQQYPWVSGNPLDPQSPLGSLVNSLAAQKIDIPANAPANQWYETGLTAMLRIIDTVRATLDPSKKTADHKVALVGEPILVMVGQLGLDATAVADPAAVTTGPPPLAAPPSMPSVSVRIGDLARPDDGVFGLFLPDAVPAKGRFAPVSQSAAQNAILNGLTIPAGGKTTQPAAHPFVNGQTAVVQVSAGAPRNVIMLTDIRGSLYATCGVLPRKKITVPKSSLDAALKNMEPVFTAGPILTSGAGTSVKPYLPPPNITGYDAGFIYQSGDSANPYPEIMLPPSPPLGDLPDGRVTLNNGWVRMEVHKNS
jgi:hypothetical protein